MQYSTFHIENTIYTILNIKILNIKQNSEYFSDKKAFLNNTYFPTLCIQTVQKQEFVKVKK